MSFNGEYKKIVKENRRYMSDVIRKFNRTRTVKEKALRVLYTGRHFARMAAKLYLLHEDMEE